MEHNHEKMSHSAGYSFKDFLPLIILFAIIIGLTTVRQAYVGWNLQGAMSDFMGFFFIIFGTFKIINWAGFVEAYRVYDIIAKRSIVYAYLYPVIELAFGVAYLTRWNPFATNLATVIVMSISAIGVARELAKGKTIICACLGTVFKVPMTYVTLIEDLLMAGMALWMLLQ